MQKSPCFFVKESHNDPQLLTGIKCLKERLGEYISLEWNVPEGKGVIFPSQGGSYSYSYCEKGQTEQYANIKLQHAVQCRLLAEQSLRMFKPCVSVMLISQEYCSNYDKDKQTGEEKSRRESEGCLNFQWEQKFLISQRSHRLPFSYGWVLPGGHLEQGERIGEGGLRECREQVGFPGEWKGKGTESQLMAWESIALDRQGQIQGLNLVFFFSVRTPIFQPQIDPKEVIQAHWRTLQKSQNEIKWRQTAAGGQGYLEGDLCYLQFCRQKKEFLSRSGSERILN